MVVELGLFQQQKLKLVMTNELRQAIHLLQYSSFELQQFIKEQALENPLIEWEDMPVYEQRRVKKKRNDDEEMSFEIPDTSEITLQQFLKQQLVDLREWRTEEKVLVFLIELLDENGYIQPEDLQLAAAAYHKSYEEILTLLSVIQSLEPAGIGARDLKECLYLQLKRLSFRDELAEQIVLHHLDDFANKKWKQLAQKYNVSLTRIQEVADLLQTLQPKPGAEFDQSHIQYIIPDLIVEKEQDDIKIIVNDVTIKVNQEYYHMLQSKDKEVASYVKDQYEKFSWLEKSILQRKRTLVNVMKTIIECQYPFFMKGEGHLQPLTLKEVAEKAEVHESTVSRVTTGKYVQTPYGLYELKYFFPSGIQHNTSADAVSSDMIKREIQRIIDSEDKTKPLSDQQIANLLEQKELKVSRRTVAKYREQMNILSSTQRKRFD